MKVINKQKLERLMDMTREYFSMPIGQESEKLIKKRLWLAQEIEADGGPAWFSLESFIISLLSDAGLWTDVTNEQIIGLLMMMGWRVAEAEA